MSNVIGDPSFGIKSQALAVLHQLASAPPEFAPYNDQLREYECMIGTFPMYNGRERGVCLVVQKGWAGSYGKPALHIFFAEHRNSDRIRFWIWEDEPAFNAPVFPAHVPGSEIEMLDETVGYGRVDLAVQKVFDHCERFFAEYKAEYEAKQEAEA